MILIILCVLGALLLIFGGWIIGGYNGFVNGRLNVKTQWSNIKTEYQRRADLILNLVEAVKSHKAFEKDTLVKVVQARSGNFGKNQKAEAKTINEVNAAFSKMMVVFEKYPELKSNEHYSKFMDEVRVTEDRVNVARTDYNDVVREYNLTITMFPSKILAGVFSFKEEEFFKNDEESDKPIRAKFD